MTLASKPLIALPADCPFFDGYIWHAAPEQYIKAAQNVAKVTPVIVPSIGNIADLSSILNCVDGVLITGAKSNIEPHHYGQKSTAQHEPFDPSRDNASLALIRATIERQLPLLAICRGLQELNVALGGTLSAALQEIEGKIDHRATQTTDNDQKFAIHQTVHINHEGCLATILGEDTILVNSVHQQGIEQLAPRLIAEATAPDGTIEAVRVKNTQNFALGLQWHPEYWAETDTSSRKIFEAFGKAVYCHHKLRLNA
ncbi:gamma-glutamyl-gamma-aminobutyrate hydrolase family protein [Bartonella tamiae]|uniref:gamma-glutamyl-gamma-aminobutyrate hydrolase n=1 Tax=Bartonella tamiae Th239 TaxID=1094558 RepID=J0ZLR6_9HYPH|nr:gamma-glutamyl-gamma-aminobutyrate hydrolase family protein [Bartonella tamiae]EJF89368.1 hypothetical protein ME5_01919 [Bartonella tamiae Th239]EJF92767.1 hypothetical protein MEG_01937 [Bartonella tamiae Th307]